MQPVIMMGATVPGLIYINGRFVGEANETNTLTMPVNPTGALYIEHQPLTAGYLPLARRLTLSGGRVLPESVADEPGLSVVLWPAGAVELELEPEPLAPEPATAPDADTEDGDGVTRTIESMDDVVGHVRVTTYNRADGGEPVAVSTEYMWPEGGPRWPATPEATMLAAVEAHLLGLTDEARGYFTPGAAQSLIALIPDGVAGAVPMRYPMPGGRAAVGLVTLLGSQCARVSPLYYDAVPMGGPQGNWRIQDMLVGM